ncbi:MAG: hypothetical protein MJ115_00175 [Clostridia bacterium]|nr:hypothetical protein [Clostridia bacterium]
MFYKEDSDIKIFDPSKKKEQSGDMLSYVEGMAHDRQNGNVDKAKELGVNIALSIYDEDQPSKLSDEIFLSAEIFPQLCALMLFSTEAALNYYLPSQQLSAIAINALHEVMSRNNLPIYEEIKEGPAFSFYFLNVRKGGNDIPHDIGKAFAMLCNRANDSAFIEEGARLYALVLDDIQKQIAEIKFEN